MSIKIIRHEMNPLLTPKDIKPTFDHFKVEGAFNAGIAEHNGEVLMLLRVAESVISEDSQKVNIPLLQEVAGKWDLCIKQFDRILDSKEYDFSDPRVICGFDAQRIKYTKYLTSLSHLRLARSKDGVNFRVDEKPFIFPEGKYETWGVEDPRITLLDDWYYINYTAVSEYGAATALARTKDFKGYERLGIIFPPENKDVCIFPEKINGLYYAFHRPVPKDIGNPNIWIASSTDIINWGNHQLLISVTQDDSWENGRIGGGAPSFKTDKGWVHIYHAADKDNRYCLGAFLTALDNPGMIITKTKTPILEPEFDYEQVGFFNNAVFTCGIISDENTVKIYYGAADERMALAEIEIAEIYKALGL